MKGGFYLEIEHDKKSGSVEIMQKKYDARGEWTCFGSISLHHLEAAFLSIALEKHLQDKRRKTIFVGKDRK